MELEYLTRRIQICRVPFGWNHILTCFKNKRSKNDHRKWNLKDLNSSCRELSDGGLGIVVALLVCWQINFSCACTGGQTQLYLKSKTKDLPTKLLSSSEFLRAISDYLTSSPQKDCRVPPTAKAKACNCLSLLDDKPNIVHLVVQGVKCVFSHKDKSTRNFVLVSKQRHVNRLISGRSGHGVADKAYLSASKLFLMNWIVKATTTFAKTCKRYRSCSFVKRPVQLFSTSTERLISRLR